MWNYTNPVEIKDGSFIPRTLTRKTAFSQFNEGLPAVMWIRCWSTDNFMMFTLRGICLKH